jgi:hypothetical protein
MGQVLNRLHRIIAEPTSKEMGADRLATSKTGANRRGNVHACVYISAWRSV